MSFLAVLAHLRPVLQAFLASHEWNGGELSFFGEMNYYYLFWVFLKHLLENENRDKMPIAMR